MYTILCRIVLGNPIITLLQAPTTLTYIYLLQVKPWISRCPKLVDHIFMLVPLGVAPDTVFEIAKLSKTSFPVESEWIALADPLQPPIEAYNWERMQFDAIALNRYIGRVFREFIQEGVRVIGVVAADGYIDGMNYVFGLASRDFGVASVYVKRLESSDRNLYFERVVKEVLHESGHLAGLPHCSNPKCVMSFSNSVREVDYKAAWFCESCRLRIR